MDHTISFRDGRYLAGNEEPEFSVESPGIDALPTLRQGSFSTIRHMDQIRTGNATSNRPRRQISPRELRVNPVTAAASNRPFHHTHLQHSCWGIPVDRVAVSAC
jgi:hypothetical protein